LWGDYLSYALDIYDLGSGIFTEENEEIKISTEGYRIIKKGNFYDFDFKDYVECAIMVTDDPREETVGVDYLIQPMPKKYITKEDSEDSNNKFCPSCLEQIIVPGNFCTNCGNKLI
jgi:hypothetical protein